jgi:hypothetical protein
MLVIGSTVDEPEIVSVPVTGAVDGPLEVPDDAAGDPPFEQAASRSAAARMPAAEGRSRIEWVNEDSSDNLPLVRVEHPRAPLTHPYRHINGA